MADGAFTPISVFYSYSHKDEELRLELEAHLAALRRSGLIHEWHDRMIDPGQQWKNQIDEHLDSASLILFLISADFINSGYCVDVEVARALQRHKAKEAVIVPIILRPVLWQVIPWLEELQALPKNALPIVQWSPRDLAYVSVCEGIIRIVHRPVPAIEPRRPSSSRARKRFFDAAIPARVPVNKPSALLVMVRRSDSLGLTGVVESEPEYRMSGKDVRSKPATLHFPTQDGIPQALDLTVKVESPQFEPKSQNKAIHVPPKGDSQPHVLLLTPTELGDLTLSVGLTLGSEQIASCMLRTEGIAAERADEPPRQNAATAAAADLEEEAEHAPGEFTRLFGAEAPAASAPATDEWFASLKHTAPARPEAAPPDEATAIFEPTDPAAPAPEAPATGNAPSEYTVFVSRSSKASAVSPTDDTGISVAPTDTRLFSTAAPYAPPTAAPSTPPPPRPPAPAGMPAPASERPPYRGPEFDSDQPSARPTAVGVGARKKSSTGWMKVGMAASVIAIAGVAGSYIVLRPSVGRPPIMATPNVGTEAGLPAGLDPGLTEIYHDALRGDPAALYSIGVAYSSGGGAKKDDAEAAKWFRKAAAAGSTEAMNELGHMYEEGAGVPRNRAEAIQWYGKAAALRNPRAKKELERLGEPPQ